jgi:hypothetical protein
MQKDSPFMKMLFDRVVTVSTADDYLEEELAG